jgi:hypothetical protein
MREVFVDQDHTRVGFYKSVLDEAGIPNFIRNENSNNSLTELPSPLFFPALCVVRDEDYDEAMQILGEIYYAQPSPAADWRCPKCSEEVPGTFDSCWHCGALRTEPATNSNDAANA